MEEDYEGKKSPSHAYDDLPGKKIRQKFKFEIGTVQQKNAPKIALILNKAFASTMSSYLKCIPARL